MAMELNKVLISDSIDASCREILEGAGISVDYQPGIAKDKLLSIIKVSVPHTLYIICLCG